MLVAARVLFVAVCKVMSPYLGAVMAKLLPVLKDDNISHALVREGHATPTPSLPTLAPLLASSVMCASILVCVNSTRTWPSRSGGCPGCAPRCWPRAARTSLRTGASRCR